MKYARSNKPQSEMTATPSKYPQKVFKDKECRQCGDIFPPQAPSHLYCSQDCADKAWTTSYLKREYNITYDEWVDMYKSQDKKCLICGSEGFRLNKHCKLKLVIDHCHETGAVRGMLCHNCNRALGLLQDSKDNLRSALEYLEGATTIPKGSTPKQVEAVRYCEYCSNEDTEIECVDCCLYGT